MMQQAGTPAKFWAKAIATASYLSNRSPHSSIKMQIPEQMWTGKIPNLVHLRVFGCKVISYIHNTLRNKIDAAEDSDCIIMGYATQQIEYRIWHIKSQ